MGNAGPRRPSPGAQGARTPAGWRRTATAVPGPPHGRPMRWPAYGKAASGTYLCRSRPQPGSGLRKCAADSPHAVRKRPRESLMRTKVRFPGPGNRSWGPMCASGDSRARMATPAGRVPPRAGVFHVPRVPERRHAPPPGGGASGVRRGHELLPGGVLAHLNGARPPGVPGRRLCANTPLSRSPVTPAVPARAPAGSRG